MDEAFRLYFEKYGLVLGFVPWIIVVVTLVAAMRKLWLPFVPPRGLGVFLLAIVALIGVAMVVGNDLGLLQAYFGNFEATSIAAQIGGLCLMALWGLGLLLKGRQIIAEFWSLAFCSIAALVCLCVAVGGGSHLYEHMRGTAALVASVFGLGTFIFGFLSVCGLTWLGEVLERQVEKESSGT